MTAPTPNTPLTADDVKLEDALDSWICDGLRKADQRLLSIGPVGCSGMTQEDVDAGRVAAYQKGYQNGVKATLTDAVYVIASAKRPHVPAPAGEGEAHALCDQVQAEYPRILESLSAPPQPKGEVEAAVEHLERRIKQPGAFRIDDEQHLRTLLSALTASQAREARAVEALERIAYRAVECVGTPVDTEVAHAWAMTLQAATDDAAATLQSLKEQPDEHP